MFRWLLGKLAVKPLFKEDPYFEVQVSESLDRNMVRVTVHLICSSAIWRGKFKVENRVGYPLESQVPDHYSRDSEFFVLGDNLTETEDVVVEFKAEPLLTGSGRIEFWFERDVGVGGQIAVVGAVFGQGDQDAIWKNKEYDAKHWSKWLEDNPDWPQAASR